MKSQQIIWVFALLVTAQVFATSPAEKGKPAYKFSSQVAELYFADTEY